ncbi:hypothetical protein AAHA92_15383 [Salvia divinorum]|uniref:Uncharacterized protein n=1 Tax=Salvia divinorum TaxID=28513 RepID=A0ABD1HEP4_SALDI
MGKSIRLKREKRLRSIRREMVEPIYDKKDAAKLAIQEVVLAAPKLLLNTLAKDNDASFAVMEVETADDDNQSSEFLKPIRKKLRRRLRLLSTAREKTE